MFPMMPMKSMRAVIYPVPHDEILRTGQGIQDAQVRAYYWLAYLVAARRGELTKWERLFRKKYKKGPDGKTLRNSRGSPMVEDLIAIPEGDRSVSGVRPCDFFLLPKPCGCMRLAVRINKLKTKNNRIEPRIAPLSICPHIPDLVGVPPENVSRFMDIDSLMIDDIKAYMKAGGFAEDQCIFSLSGAQIYQKIRGRTKKVKGRYEAGTFTGGVIWHTKIATRGGVIETDISPDTKSLRAARVTNLRKLGLRKETIQNLTQHRDAKSLDAYDRFLPEERANLY